MNRFSQLGEVDEEAGHSRADDVMCDVLRYLGYGKGVDIYKQMTRYCA